MSLLALVTEIHEMLEVLWPVVHTANLLCNSCATSDDGEMLNLLRYCVSRNRIRPKICGQTVEPNDGLLRKWTEQIMPSARNVPYVISELRNGFSQSVCLWSLVAWIRLPK